MKHIHDTKGLKYIPKIYSIEKGSISAFNRSIMFDGLMADNIKPSNPELKTPPTFTRYLIPGELEQPIHILIGLTEVANGTILAILIPTIRLRFQEIYLT